MFNGEKIESSKYSRVTEESKIQDEIMRAANNCSPAKIEMKDGTIINADFVELPSEIEEDEFVLEVKGSKQTLKRSNVEAITVLDSGQWIND